MRRNHKNHIGSPYRPVFVFLSSFKLILSVEAGLEHEVRQDHTLRQEVTGERHSEVYFCSGKCKGSMPITEIFSIYLFLILLSSESA